MLISIALPDSVLGNPWMKGIFGQMLVCMPSRMVNEWHATAAQAAQLKELLLTPAAFTANILYNIALDGSAPKTPGPSMQAVRRNLAELLMRLKNPNAELYSLERIQRATTTMILHEQSLPADAALVRALGAAVNDAIEMRRRRDAADDENVRPYRFGMTLPHALNVIAWRKVYQKFPRPAVGDAEDHAVELERGAACLGFGNLLIKHLKDAPNVQIGDASNVR